MAEIPRVEIPRVQTVVCRVHGEFLRERWPMGYAIVAVRLFQAFAEDEEIQKLAGGDAGKLNGLLPEYAPLCGRYPDALYKAYEETELGVVAKCSHCGHEKLGGPCQVLMPGRRIERHHLGFECALAQKCQEASDLA